MSNDNAITRLLYAILSQKNLKDIDWNKVAHDPILSQEITNGHAARMRYSRFKKQMDGTQPTTRKPRNKNKVEKTKSPSKKIKHRKNSDDAEKIKLEHGEEHSERYTQTPDMEGGMMTGSMTDGVKTEPGLSSTNMTPLPTTPLTTFSTPSYGRFTHEHSASPSPNASFNHAAGPTEDMDEMMASFGMPGGGGGGISPGLVTGHEFYRGEMMGEQGFGMGMGLAGGHMHMGLGDPYEGLWESRVGGSVREEERAGLQGRGEGPSRVPVKSEPRWEEAYIRS